MKKTLGRARLNFLELQTALLGIERDLNSRPLCYVSDDVSDEILTPNHLIFGRSLASEGSDVSTGDDGVSSPDTMAKRMRCTLPG